MTIHHNIDKLFKNRLSDYEENPPGFVWNNIEQKLKKNRVKTQRNWIYSAAAVMALLLSFGAGYWVTNVNDNNQLAESITEFPPVTHTGDEIIIINTENTPAIIKDEQPLIVDTVSKSNTEPAKTIPTKAKSYGTGIKKVSSSGILLPPMFGSSGNDEYLSEATPTETNDGYNNESANRSNNELETIEAIQLANKTITPSLNYDERNLAIIESTVFDDYVISKMVTDRWSVGMAAAPLWSYRSVAESSADLASNADFNSNYTQNYDNEKPLLAYSVGVDVNYKVGSRWRLKSGLYYSEMGQVSENITIPSVPSYVDNSNFSINTSTGNVVVNTGPNELVNRVSNAADNRFAINQPAFVYGDIEVAGVALTLVQTYSYYEIPLVADYTVIDRKLDVNVAGGFSANILNGNNAFIENDGTRYVLDAETENLNSMNYSGVFGVGIEYPILSSLLFGFQPTFRYSLSPINSSGSVYPYSFGLYTGLRYTF